MKHPSFVFFHTMHLAFYFVTCFITQLYIIDIFLVTAYRSISSSSEKNVKGENTVFHLLFLVFMGTQFFVVVFVFDFLSCFILFWKAAFVLVSVFSF